MNSENKTECLPRKLLAHSEAYEFPKARTPNFEPAGLIICG
jgi:hypothetical protein